MADIITEIEEDHRKIRQLLERFDTEPAGQRRQIFEQVVEELARHETTEEQIVYPKLRDVADQGDEIADARISEEQHAEEMLAEMEEMDPSSEEFAARFETLRREVNEHADHEEQTVLPRLRTSLDPEELNQLGDRWQRLKQMAPTHPHPHAPNTPPWNMAAGAVAAIFDRARDAVRRS